MAQLRSICSSFTNHLFSLSFNRSVSEISADRAIDKRRATICISIHNCGAAASYDDEIPNWRLSSAQLLIGAKRCTDLVVVILICSYITTLWAEKWRISVSFLYAIESPMNQSSSLLLAWDIPTTDRELHAQSPGTSPPGPGQMVRRQQQLKNVEKHNTINVRIEMLDCQRGNAVRVQI